MKPLGCLSAIVESTVKTFAMLFGGIIAVIVLIFLAILAIVSYIAFVGFCTKFGALGTLFGLFSPGIFLWAAGIYLEKVGKEEEKEKEKDKEEQ